MAGFATPGLLFAGNTSSPERRFLRYVLSHLRGRYSRYVELCAGSFATSLIAADVGWQPAAMDTSDVTFYSSVVGTLLAGGDLKTLGTTVNGEPVELPCDDPLDQAAWLLWLQLKLRMEAKSHIEYWRQIAADVEARSEKHREQIRAQLDGMHRRIGGLRYRPLCMFDHIAEVADRGDTVIVAAPPTYRGGFEKFFDTGGALDWGEPRYQIFDPETDFHRLMAMMEGRAALLLMAHETDTGTAASDRPLFARPGVPGRTGYVLSNRPDEVFAITGGVKVATRSRPDLMPASLPLLPPDHEVTEKSTVALVPVASLTAAYYYTLWMHRLTSTPMGNNLLVVVDGKAAGVIGYSLDPIMAPRSKDPRINHAVLLRFAVGAPHNELRLTRLVSMLAANHSAAQLVLSGPKVQALFAASTGVVTVNYTIRPEARQQRGLMKRIHKERHPDGWKLTYHTDWKYRTVEETVAEFLAKEIRWRQARSK